MKFFQILLVLVSPLLVSSSNFNDNPRKRQENPSDEYPEAKITRLSGDETESLKPRETSEFGPSSSNLAAIQRKRKENPSNEESGNKKARRTDFKAIRSIYIDTPFNGNDLIFEPNLARDMMIFGPNTPIAFIEHIQEKSALKHIADEIMQEELFESFLRFLHDYPELKLDHLEASFVCKFLKFIMADGSTFADNLRRLSNAYEYRPSFLPHLFSIPNDPGFDNMFLEIVKSVPNVSNDFIFQSIGESFSFINPDDYSEDEIQSIQQRNRQYIEEYERRETSEFGPEFARLCSDMISPDYKETKLTRKFLKKMVKFVNTDVEDEADPQLRAIDYIKILSLIAIKRGYPKLFKQLQSLIFGTNTCFRDEDLPNGYFIDEDLERVVKDHPKFFSSLPLDTFKIFLGSYDPINLVL